MDYVPDGHGEAQTVYVRFGKTEITRDVAEDIFDLMIKAMPATIGKYLAEAMTGARPTRAKAQ